MSEQKQTQGIGISTILSSSMNNEHKELGSQMKEQSVDGEVIGSEIMIMFCLAKSWHLWIHVLAQGIQKIKTAYQHSKFPFKDVLKRKGSPISGSWPNRVNEKPSSSLWNISYRRILVREILTITPNSGLTLCGCFQVNLYSTAHFHIATN